MELIVENILIVSLVSIFSLVLSSPMYNDRQTAFRHRGEAIERRPARTNQEGVDNQWLQKYYHMKRPQFDRDSDLSAEPEEFLVLMKQLLDQKSFRDRKDDVYPSAILDQNMEPIAFASQFNSGDDNSDDVADYHDYTFPQGVLDPAQMDDEFQQALAEYLVQQTADQMQNSNKLSKMDTIVSKANDLHLEKKTTESPLNVASSATSILSAPVKVTVETLSPTDDASSSNKLSVIPPVSVGKGQKEFPMLRPASDNNRKFDNWAQNLETSMTAKVLQKSPSIQRLPADSLAEELNQLKLQNGRNVKKSHVLIH